MQITEEQNSGRYVITGYGKGFIIVNEVSYQQNLIISPQEIITDWIIESPEDISFSQIQVIENWNPEIVLIGTGGKQVFPDGDLMYQFMKQGIGCEIMDSAAACRTYNILLAESRNVVAAILTP